MTTTAPALRTARAEHLSFVRIVRSEWIKLFSLRSTWWSLGITIALSIGISLLIASASRSFDGDGAPAASATTVIIAPLQFTALVAGILGAIAITGEYSTGMIRSTLTAVPGRIAALLAKAVVVAAAIALTALVTFAAAIALTAPILGENGIEWSNPTHSVVPLLLGVGALASMALIGLGFGFLIRNGAGAIATTVGLLFVVPIVLSLFSLGGEAWRWVVDLAVYLPINAAQDATSIASEHALRGSLLLIAWPVVLLVTGALVLRSRDA